MSNIIKRAHLLLAIAASLLCATQPTSAQNKPTEKEYKVVGSSDFRPAEKLTLWYTQPATTAQVPNQWEEYSLPIGNGQFGASIFGGVKVDEIQFNEKSLWSGTSRDNKGYNDYGHYENFGSVVVENLCNAISAEKQVANYHRELELTSATARVGYTSADNSTSYSREYIASNPDRVIAVRYTASQGGKLSLRFTMHSNVAGDDGHTTYDIYGGASFSGKLQTVSYNARMKVVAKGGQTECDGKSITVRNADECLLIIGGGTDFDAYAEEYTSATDKLADNIKKRVYAAAKRGWNRLYAAHVADYKQLFDRASFSLNSQNTMPTDELIRNYAQRKTGYEPEVLMLEELYFAYGRYLAISSSRGVDLPSNLQGIWNNSKKPAWNCDIHANINVQMNYWPVEPTNLSELHLPFLNYIINMADSESWKRYAKDSGQERGWTCYTENNIFGGVGGFMHEYVIANAWYCTHLWQHYRYTLDKKFLERAFPAMLSATQYWLDRMILDTTDGTYVCPKEFSPEHGPVEDGMPHAQQLVWELFDNTLKAANILSAKRCGIDEKELQLIRERFEKMDRGLATETYDGAWGEQMGGVKIDDKLLREWKYSPYKVGQRGHRHISHAMCLYPFNQINSESEYFEAMVNTLRMRGDASTGWSMGWKINLWARALDGNHAHDILELALRHHSVAGGGVYYNLYDAHPPFQIDGNFGATAGIAEMLLQSHSDYLHILPALPDVWSEGKTKGLKAIGDFTVSIEWANGKANRVEILSGQGSRCVVRCKSLDKARLTINGKSAKAEHLSGDDYLIAAGKGDRVVAEW